MNQASQRESELVKQQQQKKFISMMNSLTWFIRQNPKHQDSIFECLNSVEQKKLFESIKDENQNVRITAIVFILYLLYRNEKLLNLIMKRDALDTKSGSTKVSICLIKYIIGGIKPYALNKSSLIGILKQIDQIQEQQEVLCWSLNVRTKKIQYLNFQKIADQRLPNTLLYNKQIIDPKYNIIGILTSPVNNLTKSNISIKNHASQTSLKGGYLDKFKTARF